MMCFICNDKFIYENDQSVENHNLLHKEELAGVKLSNSMKDAVKTICNICKTPQAVSRMREHTKKAHNVHITEYKLQYNIANDRNYELVERVFHLCGVCGHYIMLDSDVIATHIKKHKITHANYNAQYMIIKKNDPARSHKRKPREVTNIIPAQSPVPIRNRFPSGLQVTLNKVSEKQDVTEERKDGTAVLATGHVASSKPVEDKSVENVKSTDKPVPKKDALSSELSYAEQISMFLRRKENENKDSKASKQTGDKAQAEENQMQNEESEDLSDSKSQNSLKDCPEKILNKLPSVESLIGILEEQHSVRNDPLLASEPTLPSLIQNNSTPIPTFSNTIPTMPILAEPIPLLPSADISPFPNQFSSNQAQFEPFPLAECQNPEMQTLSPKADYSIPTLSDPAPPTETSFVKKSGLVRILSPEEINSRHDISKTTSTPIQASLPINIMGQRAIKKVKLADGRVLHLFIKNSKASDPKTTTSKHNETKKTKNVQERPKTPQPTTVQRKTMEDNFPEDPLMVNPDTPIFEDPSRMDIDPLIGEPIILNDTLEMGQCSESTTNPLEEEHLSMDTVEEPDSTSVLEEPRLPPFKEQNPANPICQPNETKSVDNNPIAAPFSDPDHDGKMNLSSQNVPLDDSGFSEVDPNNLDISTSPGFTSCTTESSNCEKSTSKDGEINTGELVSRLASKTKPTLESPKPKSLQKVSESMDTLTKIENSKEFSEMMKRISDNLAKFNGAKSVQSTTPSASKRTGKDCMDNLVEARTEKEGNEDELDLFVEDIWSENSL